MNQSARFSTFLYRNAIAAAIMMAITNTQDVNNISCDHLGIRFYESINCSPEMGNSTDCPLYFNCPNYTLADGRCAYKGALYKSGERIITDGFYRDRCVCYENYRNGKMQVRCPVAYCMRFTNSECYQKYNLESDCSIGEVCPPFMNTTCSMDGRTYREGEIFRPRGTCWKCLCQKGFNGTFEEPFCIREPCLTELFHYEKIAKLCLPVYHTPRRGESPCCPHKFICAEQIVNMELISEAGYNDVASDVNCLVGEWEIKYGTVFNMTYTHRSQRNHVTCSCEVPPLPICYSQSYF